MPKLGDLFVKVSAKGAPQTKAQLAAVDKTAAKAGTTFGGLTKAVGGMIAAFAAYRGVQLFVNWLKSTVAASLDAEVQFIKLEAVLTATKNAAGLNTEELQKMAREMMLLTGITDEEVIATEGLLLTFTQIGKETFPAALSAAADMSVMFGQDLRQSAIQLGTALNDPIRGIGRLRRIGISFTEQQKESIKMFVEQNDIMAAQGVILDELNREFGGVAEAMGTSFQGQLNIITGLYGELQEGISGALIENEAMRGVLTRVIEGLQNAEKWITENQESFEAMAEAIVAATDGLIFFIEQVSTRLIPVLIKIIEWTSKAVWAWKELWGAKMRQDIEATNKQIEHNNKLLAIWKKQREAGIITWEELGDRIRGVSGRVEEFKPVIESGTEATKGMTAAQKEQFEVQWELGLADERRTELLGEMIQELEETGEAEDVLAGLRAQLWEDEKARIEEEKSKRLELAQTIVGKVQPIFMNFFNALTTGGEAWQKFGENVAAAIKRIIVQLLALAAVGMTLKFLGLGGLIDIAAAAARIFGGGGFQNPVNDIIMQREGRDVGRLFALGFKQGIGNAFGGLAMQQQAVAIRVFADPSVMVEKMTALPFNQKNKFHRGVTLEVADRL